MSGATLEILTNPEVIAVNQDSAGIQGHRVWQEGPIQIWAKPLHDGAVAVAAFNTEPHPMDVTVDFKAIGLPENVSVRDLWLKKDEGLLKKSLVVTLPRHGAAMWKIGSSSK